MKTKIEKQPKSTIKLTITVENDKVKESYEKVLNEAVKNTELEGFRKGTAPKEMVKDKVGVSNLYGDVINDLLQTYYPQALKEHQLASVSNPKVEIKEFDIEKDLEFSAVFAVRPEVKIKDYKKALKKYYQEKLDAHVKEAKDKKDSTEEQTESHEGHVHMGANEVIEILVKESEVEVADILIEEETDRMMARLTDQLRSINLPVEKYLAAQSRTADSLRKEYDAIAQKNIQAEFVMAQLIKDEKIETTDTEIDDMIKAVGDPAVSEKLNAPMERLYVKTILQKNKLINKLIEEAEGGKHE